MNPVHDDPLLDVAEAISDRAVVDWARIPNPLCDEDRRALEELQVIAALGAAQQPAAPDVPLAETAAWGHLRLIESVGAGAFGHVFRAWDSQLDREVALKLLRPELSAGSLAEGRLLARVKHPNVVIVYAADERDGQTGLTMEFVRGRTLESLLETLGPFGPRETIGIGIDLCRALAAVHAAGLLHRDIKTQNVMRERAGRIVLMDFGASADAVPSTGLVGTPLYLAPEVLQGRPSTAASDLYSLGVLLFHLLTDSYPITAGSLAELERTHRDGTFRRLRDLRPDLPESLIAGIERAIAPDPAQRYGSAAAFEEVLIRCLQEPAPATKVSESRRSRHTFARVGAGLLIVGLLAAGAMQAPRMFQGAREGRVPAFQSVAILPVRNLTGNEQRDYLADGLTESLTGSLSRIPSLRVISYRSSLAYKDSTKLPADIAAELGVQMLLDGSVRPTSRPDRLQVTVNLINPKDGASVWSRTEEADTAGWQTVQHTLFELVAFEIRGPSEPTAQPAAVDPMAYEEYLRGRHEWNKRTSEAALAAKELFERAIERQPTFAAAHAGLADTYLLIGAFAWLPPGDVLPKAEAAARRALELDASLAAAHATLAYLLVVRQQWPAAQREFERAIALDPNYATAHHWYGLSLVDHDHGAAVAQIERARDLDPLSEIIGSDVAVVYSSVGRMDDAIDQAQRLVRIHPKFVEARHQLAEFFERAHRYPEALTALEEAAPLAPHEPRILSLLAIAYGRAGRAADAQRVYRLLRNESAKQFVPFVFLVMAATGAGDLDGAITYARQAVDRREPQTLKMLAATDYQIERLAPLRSRPEFERLINEAAVAAGR